MGQLKQEFIEKMAAQKEQNRLKIEAHLKEISEREYDVYKTEYEVNKMMQQESDDLRKRIKADQQKLKR